MKIIFLIFTLFLGCFYLTSFAEEVQFENVEEITFVTNKNNEIVKVKTKKFENFIAIENEISFMEAEIIPNWEQDIIHDLVGFYTQENIGQKFTKVTYSPRLFGSFVSEKYLFEFFLSASSIYLNEKYEFTEVEKYGANARVRLETFRFGGTGKIQFYIGSEFAEVKNFNGSSDNINIFTKRLEESVFLSTHYSFRSFFAKFDFGRKTINSDTEYFADLFLKTKINDGLYVFLQARVDVERNFLKERQNFERYGSWFGKIGFSNVISDTMEINLFFEYEKNKLYGFERNKMGISLKHKIFFIK